MTLKDVITQVRAGAAEQWRYEKPAHGKGPKTQLLTVGGIAVTGNWNGELGQYYVAWAPLLKRDKSKEKVILDAYRAKKLAAQQEVSK